MFQADKSRRSLQNSNNVRFFLNILFSILSLLLTTNCRKYYEENVSIASSSFETNLLLLKTREQNENLVAEQQQQIAEIFSVLAGLTRDMESVKQTLEQLLGEAVESGGSGRSRLTFTTEISGSPLPGTMLSPRHQLDPRPTIPLRQNTFTSIAGCWTIKLR